jgi:hypothetical protein
MNTRAAYGLDKGRLPGEVPESVLDEDGDKIFGLKYPDPACAMDSNRFFSLCLNDDENQEVKRLELYTDPTRHRSTWRPPRAQRYVYFPSVSAHVLTSQCIGFTGVVKRPLTAEEVAKHMILGKSVPRSF